MRSTIRAFGLCLMMLGAIGCSSVTSTHPLGEPVEARKAKRLEGVWLTAEGDPCQIRHLDENKLQVCWIAWEEKRFKLVEFPAVVTVDDGQQYLNVLAKENEEDEVKYTFFRLKNEDESLMLLNLPNADAFEKAVNDGELMGTVEKKRNSKSVTVTSSKQQFDTFVHPDRVAEQFEIDPSLVLRRVKSFAD